MTTPPETMEEERVFLRLIELTTVVSGLGQMLGGTKCVKKKRELAFDICATVHELSGTCKDLAS